jgi:hypothetical protein
MLHGLEYSPLFDIDEAELAIPDGSVSVDERAGPDLMPSAFDVGETDRLPAESPR